MHTDCDKYQSQGWCDMLEWDRGTCRPRTCKLPPTCPLCIPLDKHIPSGKRQHKLGSRLSSALPGTRYSTEVIFLMSRAWTIFLEDVIALVMAHKGRRTNAGRFIGGLNLYRAIGITAGWLTRYPCGGTFLVGARAITGLGSPPLGGVVAAFVNGEVHNKEMKTGRERDTMFS